MVIWRGTRRLAIVGSFLFTQLIWATLYGYLLWGDLPGRSILIGGAVVVASGLYVFYREIPRRARVLAPPGMTS